MKLCLACQKPFSATVWRCVECGWEPAESLGFPAFAPEFAEINDGYAPEYFAPLRTLEASHFWFRARNRLIQSVFGSEFPGAASFLEIGCGTGFVLSGMRAKFPGLRLEGSDFYSCGLQFAQERLPGVALSQMDARRIPLEDEFDVIGAFDVLEHIDEDEEVLGAMYRACRTGGGILISVPQHRFLWSAADDHACHKRRYSRQELVQKVQRAGFRVAKVTSFVSILLQLMLASRLRRARPGAEFDPLAEFRIPRPVNAAFEAVMDVGHALIMKMNLSLPAGGSLLLAGRKS